MKCLKCNKDHDGSYGSGKYCNRACANSRIRTPEIKEKIRKGVINSDKFWKGIENKKKWFDYKEHGKKIKKFWDNKILESDYELLSFERLRKRIILEQNGKCNHCGINSWNNKPITLELEHIDGCNINNIRENLEAICPNCHSQTNTWRGKNKTNKRYKVSNDEIVKVLIETKNIRQTLLKVGLSPKGGNYKRVYNIIKNYNIIL